MINKFKKYIDLVISNSASGSYGLTLCPVATGEGGQYSECNIVLEPSFSWNGADKLEEIFTAASFIGYCISLLDLLSSFAMGIPVSILSLLSLIISTPGAILMVWKYFKE